MTILRSLARPMLASVFVYDGIDAVVDSKAHASRFLQVQPLLEKAGVPPVIADDANMLAKLTGGVTCLSGLGLAFGIAPRANALILTALNLPITLVNTVFTIKTYRNTDMTAEEFINEDDSPETSLRRRNRNAVHTLLQGASVAGGLLLAVFDREGRPSLSWRAQTAAQRVAKKADKITS